jgi:voltage-gated potassium channel Kch
MGSGRSTIWPQVSAWVLAVVAFGLGVFSLWFALPGEPVVDLVYRALQLFVLDGGALQDVTEPNGGLQVARFLAPFATVFGVLVALRGGLEEEVLRRRIARSTGHTIVCGDGPAARVLARNLVDDYRKRASSDGRRAVVLIGRPPVRAEDGLLVVEGDAREPATLRAAGVAGARMLYACDDSSAANAAVALAAGNQRSPTGTPRLSTFAQVRSEDLVEALRVRRLAADPPPAVTIDFFAIPDIAGRVVVGRHPVGPATPTIIGSGPLARAVLWAVVRGPATTDRTVVLAGRSDEAVQAEIERFAAGTLGWTLRAGGETDADGIVYVCLPDEDEAIATGLQLARTADRDVVVCLQRESPFRQALGDEGRMKIFGVLDEACREKAIEEDSVVGRAARAIHEHYRAEAAARHETVDTNPSMRPWAELPPHLQASNIAQAEHIGAKLAEIHAVLRTVPAPTPFAFTDDEVEQLAQAEHRRWVDERTAADFTYGPRRVGTFHPDLVDWSELGEVARNKDRTAVRHLPELLAAEGLHIWRAAGPRAPARADPPN